MDWPLGREHLSLALGEAGALPSARDFERLLANAEIGLLSGHDVGINHELLGIGWYLHAVASALPSPDPYPVDRRRRAFQIAAHIFDLQLASARLTRADRLRMVFASQVGFVHSSLDPNAIAVYRRSSRARGTPDPILDSATASLDFGSAILGSDAAWLHKSL